ncbi:SRPBCC family protein [Hyalangium gracile]|uniref:SRPBCC family protein n=1 Tax=Hyalangium gracile TaxID=394092 RepID=UPI001CCF2D81|nr:SRPBCC family protein [Hyalangium gracile]
MRLPDSLRRLAALVLTTAALFVGFFLGVRPWYLVWGATDAEQRRSLPGDELVPDARDQATSTRAITIQAPPEKVWPWLAQLGQDRGGFYSYEVLEDLVGTRMENADRVHPEFQAWKVGDKLWMYPPEKLDGQGHALLARIDPGRVLGFVTRQYGTPPTEPYNGSWSFILEPLGEGATRLLIRGRAGGTRAFLGSTFDHALFEPMHFVMERKMMETLEQRAEGGRVSEVADTAHPVLWTVTFALFIVSLVRVVRHERWLWALAAFAAAGIVFQILTFAQPPLAVGGILVLGVVLLLWLPPMLSPRRAAPRARVMPSRLTHEAGR